MRKLLTYTFVIGSLFIPAPQAAEQDMIPFKDICSKTSYTLAFISSSLYVPTLISSEPLEGLRWTSYTGGLIGGIFYTLSDIAEQGLTLRSTGKGLAGIGAALWAATLVPAETLPTHVDAGLKWAGYTFGVVGGFLLVTDYWLTPSSASSQDRGSKNQSKRPQGGYQPLSPLENWWSRV